MSNQKIKPRCAACQQWTRTTHEREVPPSKSWGVCHSTAVRSRIVFDPYVGCKTRGDFVCGYFKVRPSTNNTEE